MLSELVIRRLGVEVDMYLNRQKQVRVSVGALTSYFNYEGHTKRLLIGGLKDSLNKHEIED